MKKIIIFLFVGVLFSLTNLLADEISDCLELEKLRAEKQESSSSESRKIARKICGIRARLGWSTEIAKDFDLCMKKERIVLVENEKIAYNELIEIAIESCNNQAKDKKELEKELKAQEELKQKELIKEKKLEIKRLEEEKKLRKKKEKALSKKTEKVYSTNESSGNKSFIGITPLFLGNINIKVDKKNQRSQNTCSTSCFQEDHSINSGLGFKIGWHFETGGLVEGSQLALVGYQWETEFENVQNLLLMYEIFSKPSGLLIGMGLGRGELSLNSERLITNNTQFVIDESGSGLVFGIEIGYYKSFSDYFQFSINYLFTFFDYDLASRSCLIEFSFCSNEELEKEVTFQGFGVSFDFVF